ncbi:MAG: alpha-amylase [Bacteroidales bacterium]|nr:alpha-amylase [Bacteroidales bacterium]
MDKPIIYQLIPRLWGNIDGGNVRNGSLEENGTGKFKDIDSASLEYIKWLGCSHIWLTGIIRHATKTSTGGCMPSNPQFVKGRAGSPYAIVDYYDVNPYLAEEPENRMQEFEELLDRIHAAGLKVILDFVPNHVSRDYGCVNPTPGHPILGQYDNKNVHWAPENDFFYYPGQTLVLPTPVEEGTEPYYECPAKATGNNCFSNTPGINDWYETVKINYCDTYSGTWEKMHDVLRFWACMGVDGFRCDMVELVPDGFMKWLIRLMREEFPHVMFIGEVYQKSAYHKYIRDIGFDYLYDKSGLYDTLRMIMEKNVNDNGMQPEPWQSAEGITRNWQNLGDLQPYMLNFIENHDEQRIASDFFAKDGENGIAPLITALCINRAPFMLYMGQELGEKGMDDEGFSGRDGRTTIFDWWCMPSMKKLHTLIHTGLYKDIEYLKTEEAQERAGIDAHEADIFCKYAKALRIAATDDAVRKGSFYDLCYCNCNAEGFDCRKHFAFLRDHEDETLLFAANFSNKEASMEITIPQHAFEWMNLPVTKYLSPDTKIRLNIPAFGALMFKLT